MKYANTIYCCFVHDICRPNLRVFAHPANGNVLRISSEFRLLLDKHIVPAWILNNHLQQGTIVCSFVMGRRITSWHAFDRWYDVQSRRWAATIPVTKTGKLARNYETRHISKEGWSGEPLFTEISVNVWIFNIGGYSSPRTRSRSRIKLSVCSRGLIELRWCRVPWESWISNLSEMFWI